MYRSVNVAVVEPNPIFREGLVRILSEAGYRSCLGFGCLNDIRETTVATSKRTLFIIDFGEDFDVMMSGIENLRSRYPSSPIVILAERYIHRSFVGAIRAGAHGYILKFVTCEALTKAVDLAALGEPVFPAQALQLFCGSGFPADLPYEGPAPLKGKLSSREIEVLNCLTLGSSNKLIARQFGITEATVKVHVKAILRKIRVKNRTEAAIWARSHGLNAPALPAPVAALLRPRP